ncbi:MAG: hypothetical protein IPP74_14100 [Alphaproteobacteria bacterium]|nr:hypothetical protein [Alphaproteobacteria bacterium]
MMKLQDKINACKHLYLRSLSEPRDNCLRIVFEEATLVRANAKDLKLGKDVMSEVGAIASDSTCSLFEIIWPSYVIYSVRNESFSCNDETEKWEGRLLCLYSKSHFLDYAQKATIACDAHPGPLKHWGINCLNHTIDVISYVEPEFTILSRQVDQSDKNAG